ncbi:MAG: DUF2309 domain-containing protein [Pirellula sp.]|nr:DUF2309 domain-containing protein [Pirellula sp.]
MKSPTAEDGLDLDAIVEHLAHLLPAQGPINVFVHHNTLHAFEERHFLDAVAEGTRVFGGHPFLSEPEYRAELSAGAFDLTDVEAALIEDLGNADDGLIGMLGTRFALYHAMLEYPVHIAPKAELEWLIAETDALRKFRKESNPDVALGVIQSTRRWLTKGSIDANAREPVANFIRSAIDEVVASHSASGSKALSVDAWEAVTLQLLWQACQRGVNTHWVAMDLPEPVVRHRDALYRATGVDSDLPVNELMIRFSAAFVDQGFSQWDLPNRNRGFFRSFVELYRKAGPPHAALVGLGEELERVSKQRLEPRESIQESLELLGVSNKEVEPYISASLLSLRGWGGMVHQLESRGDRSPFGIPHGSLFEFLAVRLLVERVALRNALRQTSNGCVDLKDLRMHFGGLEPTHDEQDRMSRAYTIFQIAQIRGWSPQTMLELSPWEWRTLIEEVDAFGSFERRRVFQLAFERGYRRRVLDAMTQHSRTAWIPSRSSDAAAQRPSVQIVCCIDDREESFRRHFEEVDPSCETFGAPGFFAVPMYYRGASDAHFVPLCPIIMKPKHYVIEQVLEPYLDEHGRRARIRKALGRQAHVLHKSSRSFVGGLAFAAFGPLASLPLVARVLFPRSAAAIRRSAGRWVAPPDATRLTLEREAGEPTPQPSGYGFRVEEMADAVERLLRDIGLTHHFARLVVIVGHGSSSLNNPHESAYNCGACGGGRGGPNARAICAMANDPRVRARIADRGLRIPDDTVFLGAYHNTCSDSVDFLEVSRLPDSHHQDFDRLLEQVREVRERNAHERSRRFVSASLSMSPERALRHVEERSEDLSQTRPEYNHATNAICTVGRRSRTRGLFLDRRSFLVSYDPTQDDTESSILTRILSAVIPVCAGINLEYYFSRVDVSGYGCGSKLPHNVTSLVGVMDGAASDLRTGLSSQMVEIHDPLRILFVIETEPESFIQIMQRVPVIDRLCGNGWVQIATLSPNSDEIHLLQRHRFVRYAPSSHSLIAVRTSQEWYRGKRGNLGFAQILEGYPNQVLPR